MSLLARAAVRSRTPFTVPFNARQRSLHVDNVVGENMPFKYEKKGAYGAKLAVFLVSGFSIPFVAAWYQLKKSASG